METLAIKEKINRNIALIEDDTFLNAINQILESKTSDKKYYLSDFQLDRIKDSDKDERLGKLITNKDLQIQVEKWLNIK